ncbi:MAG: RNA methyltransferase [Bacteroidota bacterium]
MEERNLISDHFDAAGKKEVVKFLKGYVTTHKQQLIEKVLNQRTRFITLVMEDIFKPHNASAVIRTAECLGVQDIHIIEKSNQYKPNPWVLRGALKWMSVHHYAHEKQNSSEICFNSLKEQGYEIVAADVTENSIPLPELEVTGKTALVMGTEHTGISDYVRENADKLVTIPMSGFTESFNVSVSAAICLNHLLAEIRKKELAWQLSEEEKEELRYEWYKNIPTHAVSLVNHYVKQNKME